MASAVEQYTSRTGDVSSLVAGFSASRTYVVTVDSVGQNPDDLLRDPDATTGVGNDAVPFNTPHPTRSNLVSSFYVIGTRIRSLKWFVRIVYAPPSTLVTADSIWEPAYQPGLASILVNHDWRGVPIGPAAYEEAPLGPVPPGGGNSTIYNVRIPAVTGENPKPAKVLDLIRVDGPDADPVKNPAFLTNVERTEPVGSFTLTHVFEGLNEELMSNIIVLANIVNRTTFKGFPPRTIKFIGPAVFAGHMDIPGTGGSGFGWRVTLIFEWNSTGYRYQAQDVFEHPSGTLPVTVGGEPVIREWLLYPEGNLELIELMVGQLANRAVRIGIGQVEPRGPVPIGGGRP